MPSLRSVEQDPIQVENTKATQCLLLLLQFLFYAEANPIKHNLPYLYGLFENMLYA